MKLEVDSFKTGDLDVMQLHLSGKTKHRWGCGCVERVEKVGRIYIQPFYYAFKYLVTLVIYLMIWMDLDGIWVALMFDDFDDAAHQPDG